MRFPKKLASIVDAVGRTPMLRLKSIERDTPGVEIYCKLEFLNPGGSVKDRPALQMIREALESGQLEGAKTVIDATSGNTGVAYGMVGAALGILAMIGAAPTSDVMAHLLGLLSGLGIGLAAPALLRFSTRSVDRGLAWAALFLVAAAWLLARTAG